MYDLLDKNFYVKFMASGTLSNLGENSGAEAAGTDGATTAVADKAGATSNRKTRPVSAHFVAPRIHGAHGRPTSATN